MKQPALRLYVAVITGLGLLALLSVLSARPPRLASVEFLLLAAYVVVGEVFPLRVMRGGREGVLTVSTPFAFALLLWVGAPEALVALVAASVVGDLLRRSAPIKVVFNAAQFAVCIALAGTVLEALRSSAPAPVPITETGFAATFASAAVFFLVNFLLSGVVVALATNVPAFRLLRQDLLPQALWTGVLLTLSPIVVAAADTHLGLVPLFVVPMLAVYRSTEVLLQREHEALHDPLTGVPNRNLFGDRVNQAVLAAERSGEQAAIMILDLDGFKDVNDTLGHKAGDEVLRLVAERLAGTLRGVDTVARLGGDEFGIVVSPVSSAFAAKEVARKVRHAIHEPLRFDEVVMTLEASVGIALAPTHGTEPDSLVTYADAAMFEAKRLQSGTEIHDPQRFEQTANRMTRLARLRHAVREGQFELYYQPKYAVGTGVVDGLEALVRWKDPEHGLILPDRFIPLAEETGLIRDVTRFVMSEAIDEVARLQRVGLPQRVAVNVSVRDLQDPTLPDEVVRLLQQANVAPHWLELEITEQTLMSNPGQAAAVISRLHDIGVRVTIDDFGTGNTSLALLSHLPVDCLKVDRSLVAAMADGRADAVIVRTTIDLGHNLGMSVVAEGVETHEVWQHLGRLGCDSAQGFYFSPPIPAGELRRHLERRAMRQQG